MLDLSKFVYLIDPAGKIRLLAPSFAIAETAQEFFNARLKWNVELIDHEGYNHLHKSHARTCDQESNCTVERCGFCEKRVFKCGTGRWANKLKIACRPCDKKLRGAD